MNKIVFIIISALLFASCEKFIDMEIPDEGRKITVNSFINDQQNPTVYLSQSRFILDGDYSFPLITDAHVTLYKGETQVTTFNHVGDGIYMADYVCEKGNSYTLKVSRGNEEVSSTTHIPESVPFQLIDTATIISQDMYQSTPYLRFRIKIEDPVQDVNYYMISFKNKGYPISFYTRESFVENGTDRFLNYAIFSDKLINGQSRVLTLDIETYNFMEEVNPLEIYVNAISKDMYLYYVQLSKYYEAQGGFLAEPVMVYSNIQNGLGIFGGYTISKMQMNIPQLVDPIIEGKK